MLVPFLDELQSGLPVLAAADVRADLGVGHAVLAAILFGGPLLVGFEGVLLLAVERWDRGRVLSAALVAVAVSELAVTASSSAWTLAASMAVWYVAAGVVTGQAEVMLVAGREDADRRLARWGLLATLGDLAAPALVAATSAVGLGWRAGLRICAVLSLMDAVAVGRAGDVREPEDDDEEPLRTALPAAASDPRLVGWLVAGLACTLLDELFVAFGGMYVRETGTAGDVALGFAAFAAGGIVGLAVTERLLSRVSTRAVLAVSCAGAAAALLAWVGHPTGLAGAGGLALLGAFVAPMHPLSRAGAYSRARPAIVAALDRAVGPLELLPPLVLGWLADHESLRAAVLATLLQPLVVLVVALLATRPARPPAAT